jgi:hypothetical protein
MVLQNMSKTNESAKLSSHGKNQKLPGGVKDNGVLTKKLNLVKKCTTLGTHEIKPRECGVVKDHMVKPNVSKTSEKCTNTM